MIKITGLKKSFGDLHVLKGIDFELEKGEVASILGPSGTGKSTLLRCINYLEIPDAGTITIDDVSVEASKHSKSSIYELRRQSAMIFQNFYLFNNKTALDNIALALEVVHKQSKSEARAKGMEILEQIGLADKANAYPYTLSGGQQQRVAIGRSIALQPKVLLLDEPTSALDPYLVGEVLSLIRKLARSHNMTMLIVTHEINFAREVSDKIIFLDEGYIIEQGTPQEFFDNPQDERTKLFLKHERRELED